MLIRLIDSMVTLIPINLPLKSRNGKFGNWNSMRTKEFEWYKNLLIDFVCQSIFILRQKITFQIKYFLSRSLIMPRINSLPATNLNKET